MTETQYVVTGAEMRAVDRRTSEIYKIDAAVLMERAALALAEEIGRVKPPPRRVLVLAGTGGNGGDGLAAARLLWQAGYDVTCVLDGEETRCSDLCARQLAILRAYGLPVRTVEESGVCAGAAGWDVILDALLGVGLSRPVGGQTAALIQAVNESGAFVVSCDIPSGVCASTGRVLGCAVRADRTVTFGFFKRGLLLYPGAACAGRVRCAPVGITQDAFERPGQAIAGAYTAITCGREALRRLPRRRRDGNKGSFGKILLAAGSRNMAGAAVFAGTACFRMGAGLLRLLTPEANRTILQTALPEAVLRIRPDAPAPAPAAMDASAPASAFAPAPVDASAPAPVTGSAAMAAPISTNAPASAAMDALAADLAWADCIVAGPGLGRDKTTRELLYHMLSWKQAEGKTWILDADALNLEAEDETLRAAVRRLAQKADVIVTPHLGEFARLTGTEMAVLKEDIITHVIEYASQEGVTVVCKDACTVVAEPGGRVYLNRSGSDALATAGSGDVLAGMLGALAGQGLRGFEAASLGVYLHGLAGEEAEKAASSRGVMASDLPEALARVLQKAAREERKTEKNGKGKNR